MFIVSFASMKKSALEEEVILISSVIQLMSEEQYSFFSSFINITLLQYLYVFIVPQC